METGSISYLFHKTQKRNKLSIPAESVNVCLRPEKCPAKGSFHFDLSPFLYSFPPQPLSLPGFFHLQALERAPISLGNSFPINSSPHFPCKLNILSFQLASPPSIYMDSWWAACNLRKGPKWTHNTSQGRDGAYGPNQIGFGLQNHKKQRSTQAGPTNWLNQMPTSPSG